MPHLLVLLPFGRAGGSYLLPSEVFFAISLFMCVLLGEGMNGRESIDCLEVTDPGKRKGKKLPWQMIVSSQWGVLVASNSYLLVSFFNESAFLFNE